MLFLRGTHLFLRSSVLVVLDFKEVNVTLENTGIFGSVLSGEGESAGGDAAEVLPFSLNSPPFLASFFLFCSRAVLRCKYK
jgi:hypothetical protein